LTLARSEAAEAPPVAKAAKAAEALVAHDLVEPLAAKERDRGRFSRARPPAQERRVRILDDEPQKDAKGGVFFTFVVDARYGLHPLGDDAGWRPAAIAGCAYVARGEVFVKLGDRHSPAARLLGKNVKPAAENICQGAATEVAKAAPIR
jgi:hypothetical protein